MAEPPALDAKQIERYARHIVLPEIGGAGQQRLAGARIAMIGAGGLGSPALTYLAAAGVGTLTVIDDDAVSLSNLQRQTLHMTDAVGQPKAKSAAAQIAAINPHVRVDGRVGELAQADQQAQTDPNRDADRQSDRDPLRRRRDGVEELSVVQDLPPGLGYQRRCGQLVLRDDPQCAAHLPEHENGDG